MRLVLDTNTLVSAILSPNGPPRRLLDAARAQRFELCTSPVLLAELLDVITRTKFAARLSEAGITPMGIVGEIRRMALVIAPVSVPRVISADPDDDHVLACALAGNADLIVSGDSDLDVLGGNYLGIPLLSPAKAVQFLEK